MAVIHRSRWDPKYDLRKARTLMFLCWPMVILSLGLALLFYWQCWARLWALAVDWRTSFTAWATAPGVGVAFAEEWQKNLWQVAEVILQGVGWAIAGLTAGLPGLLAFISAVAFACLFTPSMERYRELRIKLKAVAAAVKLLSPMPDSCHIFLHKRIVFEGAADTELILVGPGGMAVMEVRSASGMIEGCVTDAVLRRRRPDGDVEKFRNPARPAVAGVTRLSNYLQSLGLNAWIVPCVLFVHPEASAYVTQPDVLRAGGRRQRISSCVMTDATSFWEQLGRDFVSGRVLNEAMVEQLVAAIRKAPEGKRRR